MLKKSFRLPKTGFRAEKVIRSKTFVLKTAINGESNSRFGFIVSKKIDKRAVVRNKIKRILRSCAEKNLKKIKPGFDFLLILKKNDENLCENFEDVLEKEKFLI